MIMTTFANTDELEVLKAQMQVLRAHLQNNEIVSSEMFDATIKAEIKNITGKRKSFILTMVVDSLMGIYFAWIYFSRPGFMSTLFLVSTLCWCLLWVFVAFLQYRQNMRDRLLNDSMTEVVKDLITLKQQNLRVAYLSIVASVAWLSVLFYETWDDISHNAEHCIIVCLILFFVSYSVSSRIQKTHRTINHLLRQIQEVK